jgi:hypothetical protein
VHRRPVEVISRPLTGTGVVGPLGFIGGVEVATGTRNRVEITTGGIEVAQILSGGLKVGVGRRIGRQRRDAGRPTDAEVGMALGRGELHRQGQHHVGRHPSLLAVMGTSANAVSAEWTTGSIACHAATATSNCFVKDFQRGDNTSDRVVDAFISSYPQKVFGITHPGKSHSTGHRSGYCAPHPCGP